MTFSEVGYILRLERLNRGINEHRQLARYLVSPYHRSLSLGIKRVPWRSRRTEPIIAEK